MHETLRGLLRPAMAEMIGSAMFIFISCGAAMTTSLANSYTFGSATIGIALTFGMSIFVIAYSIGHISGGHLNFAVTLTFAVLRKISILKCALYFLAQFLGALIGIGFLKLVTPISWWNSCFATNFIHSELTVGHAFVAEFILTFFLMFVVMVRAQTHFFSFVCARASGAKRKGREGGHDATVRGRRGGAAAATAARAITMLHFLQCCVLRRNNQCARTPG